MRRVGAWLTMAAAVVMGGCWDDPGEVVETDRPGLVSDPIANVSAAAGAARSPAAAAASSVAYVSLRLDSVPSGEIAVIRNLRTGGTVRTAMANGGFDPVPVAASAGDTLALDIQVSGNGAPVHLTLEVPTFRRPRVVRTWPPHRKQDVVLNARTVVVFSEPIREATINSTSVRLLRGGAPVSGRVVVGNDGLRAEFLPDQNLEPNTGYTLAVTTQVEDLSGDTLAQAVSADFATGTTTALAMAYTDPAALFVVTGNSRPALNGLLRAVEFSAILHDDGRFTGRYSLFYPEKGWGNSGRVSCFSIKGDTAWFAGVIEESGSNPETVGMEIGWLAVDKGPVASGIADQLSLAFVGLAVGGFGTAQDFCNDQSTLVTQGPEAGQKLLLQNVEVGDIVVSGLAPAVPRGALHVTTRTTGTADLDGYDVLVLCGADGCTYRSQSSIPANGDVTFLRLPPDHYTVTLTSLSDYCAVSGASPQTVDVLPGATSEVSFDVACVILDVLVPYGAAGYRFKVLTDSTSSGGGFELPGFDDVGAGFSDGAAAFSSDTSYEGEGCLLERTRKTNWPVDTDLLLRKTFDLPTGVSRVKIRVAIDNDIQVFVNGVDITPSGVPDSLEGGFQRHGGCATADGFVFTTPDAVVHAGWNLLAIRARDRGVISYVDVMLTAERN